MYEIPEEINDEQFSIKSKIFHNEEDAIEFLKKFVIIDDYKICPECQSYFGIKYYKKNKTKKIVYICLHKKCRKKISLYTNTIFPSSRISLNNLLFIIYCYILNIKNYQIINLVDISEKTFISIKDRLLMVIKSINNEQYKPIGGDGIIVQCDEIIIVKGKLILNPPVTYDNKQNTDDSTWIIAGIEDNEVRKFFLKIIPNRNSQTIAEVLNENLLPGTIIRTKNFQNYSIAVQNLPYNNLSHQIINSSHNYIESQTNNVKESMYLIENFWLHLKAEIRQKDGIIRQNIDKFIDEYKFKKQNMKEKTKTNIKRTFILLLRKIFNSN